MMVFIFVLVSFFAPLVCALVLPNDVGRLPALGWNSWNAFACDITEDAFLTAAEHLVSLGLKDAGYRYVNIDDCWSDFNGRDEATGRLLPNYTRFPNGINGTASKIHDLGLKFGIYSSAGTVTCEEYPASLGYEELDAETWAEWGVDYLKYDNCGVPSNWTDECDYCVADNLDSSELNNGTCIDTTGLCPEGYDYTESNTAERYRRMRDALLDQERPILFSMCDWGYADVKAWGNDTGSSWRMSRDIRYRWDSVLRILNLNSFQLNSVDFWSHSDADMLEVGNGGLTVAESRSHFAFWAAMKSPLLIGTPLDGLQDEYLAILLNKYLLAFHQDTVFGAPATPYKWGTNPDWTFNATRPAEFWAGHSQNGMMVLLFNTDDGPTKKTANWGEVPGLEEDSSYSVLDAWTGEGLGCVAGEWTVELEAHDTAVLLVQNRCSSGIDEAR